MSFKDHFSEAAAGYVRFRPRYPETLFDYWRARLRDERGRGIARREAGRR